MNRKYTSLEEFFSKAPDRFPPDALKNFCGIFHFEIKEASKPNWTVELLAEGIVKISQEKPPQTDISISLNEKIFLQLINKETSPMKAFFEGKIKVTGNKELLFKGYRILEKMRQPV